MGLTTQVPQTREITSNLESSKKRTIKIAERQIIVRKPLVKISQENIIYLQFLDIIRYGTEISIKENRSQLINFIQKNQLKKKNLNKYIEFYPQKVERIIWQNNLYDEFT